MFTFYLEFLLLGMHLFVHVDQLHAWANGSLMLIFSTIWYLFISIWNILVMFEYPEVMILKPWTRIVPFALSIVWLCYYFSGMVVEVYKWMTGDSWKDTVEEIFFAYVLWISTPTALTEASYVVNMVIHTDDIVIDKNNPYYENESDDEDDDKDGKRPKKKDKDDD